MEATKDPNQIAEERLDQLIMLVRVLEEAQKTMQSLHVLHRELVKVILEMDTRVRVLESRSTIRRVK